MPAFAVILDSGGCILNLNEAARRLTGLPPDETSGMPIWDLPLWTAESRTCLREAVAGVGIGEIARRTLSIETPNGGRADLHISLTRSSRAGGEIDIFLLETTMAAPMAEDDDIAMPLAEFAELAAHDFNNLLAGLGGNLELVARRLGEDETAANRLRRASRVVFRGRILTGLMDALARRPDRAGPTDVRAVVQQAVEACRKELAGTVAFETEFEAGLWPCRCDPAYLPTAISQLLILAYDASPGNDRITVHGKNVSLNGRPTKGHPALSEGHYVVLDIRTRQPVQQAPTHADAATGQGGSIGLGTRLVQLFARDCGGSLIMGGREDGGMVASLYLPRELPSG